MSASPLLLFLAGALVVAGIAVYAAMADSKRRERLFAAATARGWTYVRESPQLVGRWSGQPFGTGDNRRVRDTVAGAWHGREFTAFTYTYETSSEDSKGSRSTTTHWFTVVALVLPTWLPTLEVRPESAMHRVLGAVGIGEDIELESEDFNRAFRVSARDPKYASDVLAPRTMEQLLAGPRTPWRIEGNTVLTWADGPLEPDVVEPRLAFVERVVSLIPAFVWKDHGYDPQVTGPGV